MSTYLKILLIIICTSAHIGRANPILQTGDIIFQTSQSPQSMVIQKATHSPYSHMGMIVYKNKQIWVIEAIQPVRYTLLEHWIQRGVGQHYVVKRLKTSLTMQQKEILVKTAESYIGKPYDLYFEWNDRAIYCSELVWKAYEHALGIELASLESLKQFDLSHFEVKKLMNQRYGQNIPFNEIVIAPKSIYESKLLKEVQRNPIK